MAPARRPWLPPAWPYIALQQGLRLLCESACLSCEAPEGDPLCAACLSQLTPLPSRRCRRCLGSLDRLGGCPLCAHDAPPFEAVTALGQYSGGLRQAIRAMKYRGRADIGLVLGKRLGESLGPRWGRDWLVLPVPIHAQRRAERGYNQAEPLAWQLARTIGGAYDDRAIERHVPSLPFYQQGRSDRWGDAQAAFHAHPRRLEGRAVLIVDDILTSGATLWATAQAARAAGATRVRAAVLARATMRSPGIEQKADGIVG